MPDGYSTHADYMLHVQEQAAARQKEVENSLRAAFAGFIEIRSVEVIVFAGVSVHDLAEALIEHPLILKPLTAACNIAGRAIERDLGIKNVNTYMPRLSEKQAAAIAGYLKPFLPPYLEIPALSTIDRVEFVDKEIRMSKGRWEQMILAALNEFAVPKFGKRKFNVHGEDFELDAACPLHGDVRIGIDVKRIEARRDIHKRCDEIINKADKLKAA